MAAPFEKISWSCFIGISGEEVSVDPAAAKGFSHKTFKIILMRRLYIHRKFITLIRLC